MLLEAAEQELIAGRAHRAAEALEAALTADHETPADRAAVESRLVQVRRLSDPATAEHHLTALTEAARAGDVGPAHTVDLVRQLLWQGAPPRPANCSADCARRSWTRTARTRPCCTTRSSGSPGPTPPSRAAPADPGRPRPRAPGGPRPRARRAVEPPHRGAGRGARRRPCARGGRPGRAGAARPRSQLRHHLARGAGAARPRRAAVRRQAGRRRLVRPAAERGHTPYSPTWMALLSATRAEAAVRLGDLTAAVDHAQLALGHVTPNAWGVALGARWAAWSSRPPAWATTTRRSRT
ncbi:hypothetical protein ACFQ60_36365 [Streptomyces zhihengii]